MADDPKALAAEALAAVTGIQAILETKPPAVGVTQGRAAMALPKRIEAELREYLLSDKPTRPGEVPPELDYLETLEKLTRPVDPEQRQALLADFEDPQLGLSYVAVLQRGVAWLLEQLPRRTRPTLVGDVNVEPSQTEMAVFERQWQVGLDPMVVIGDMREGILVSDQVLAMQALFPLLYARVVDTAGQLLIELHARDDGKWEPEWHVEKGLFTLLQISPVSPDFAASLQKTAQAAAAAPDASQQGLQIDLRGAADPETQTQKLSG